MKIAGVLLLSVLMLIPASTALANTNENALSLTTNPTISPQPLPENTGRAILWDQYDTDGSNGLSHASRNAFGYQRALLDDFEVPTGETWVLDDMHALIIWNTMQPGSGTGWELQFWSDAGGQPGSMIINTTVVSYSEAATGRTWFSRPEAEVTYTYEPVTLTAGVYWIWAHVIGPENCFWMARQDVIWGSECWCDYEDYGFVPGSSIFGAEYDLAFQLTGESGGGDDIPPVTTCTITGTNPKIITLTATDEGSGVDYTKYKLDDGEWTDYTAPVEVSEAGDHVVYFYSVDKAGNKEEDKSQSFNVPEPALPITITIAGGLGVSATIKNTGATDLSNVDWTITLDGKLVFPKTKSGTIATLAAGAEETVKMFVFGIGKTGIVVEAGGVDASASGTVILILVIGVA